MADSRRAEIAKKKAQIEKMRKERKEKEEREKLAKSNVQTSKDSSASAAVDASASDPDAILGSLGIKVQDPTPTPAPAAQSAGDQSATSTSSSSGRPRPSMAQLSVVKVHETTIPPRELVAYSKETQTVAPEPQERDGRGPWDYYVLTYDNARGSDDDVDSLLEPGSGRGAGDPRGAHPHAMPHVEMVQPKPEPQPKKAPEMSEEEKKAVQMSEDFQMSVSRAARVMTRLLANSDPGVFQDYAGGDSEGKDDDLLAGERLKLQRVFHDERWSRRRTVTGMDWSPQFPELVVASYNANEDAPSDPDGVALIWNLKYKNMDPEYIFHCQSSVMSTCFAAFNPNLVLGGTYSGRIVLWDNRVNKRTPVQRTPLSASSHTHPVYCVNVVGTQNAHNLISVSTDGRVCSWSLDMLSQPQDCMELQSKTNKAVAATCFSFLSGDANNFIVGSEECVTYSACRHGSKAGISEVYEGHQGPLTAVDTHRTPGPVDFSPYFLTSSFDWTIKLWSSKQPYHLHSFEDNSDYVYDARWSPVHPALFAAVDGQGRLDLWNINRDTEVPTASVQLEGRPALNQCRWHSSGHHIALGDNQGRIHLFDVAESVGSPGADEWSSMVNSLQELKQRAAEREEDSSLAQGATMAGGPPRV